MMCLSGQSAAASCPLRCHPYCVCVCGQHALITAKCPLPTSLFKHVCLQSQPKGVNVCVSLSVFCRRRRDGFVDSLAATKLAASPKNRPRLQRGAYFGTQHVVNPRQCSALVHSGLLSSVLLFGNLVTHLVTSHSLPLK